MKIVIAHGITSIEVFHSIIPFVIASETNKDWKWIFINYSISKIENYSGNLLIIVRKYHDRNYDLKLAQRDLIRYKKKFDKIVYFDDSASSSYVLFSLFPYLDEYWKRSILKDTSMYSKSYYGGHVYSDYYNKNYSVYDQNWTLKNQTKVANEDFNKLKISWNIGIGLFPLSTNSFANKNYKFIKKLNTAISVLPSLNLLKFFIKFYIKNMIIELNKDIDLNLKKKKISARFTSKGYNESIGFQRELILKKISNNKIFLTGTVPNWQFIQENKSIFAMISPFGWGEICYRDFEAVLCGSYLIKPNTSHISTWPNIFDNNMYHSLDWKISNINFIESIFDNANHLNHSVNSTRLIFKKSLGDLSNRVTKMISTLMNTR